MIKIYNYIIMLYMYKYNYLKKINIIMQFKDNLIIHCEYKYLITNIYDKFTINYYYI